MAALGVCLAAACSGDDEAPVTTVAVADEVVLARADTAIESLTTMRADWSLVSSHGDQRTVVGEASAVVDLAAGTGVLDAAGSAEPGAGTGQQFVVVGDRAFRRDDGGAWEASTDTLVEVALPGFDEEGDDTAAALARVISAAPGPWTATATDHLTRYRSTGPTTGTLVELDIDADGHVVRLERSQPPFGLDVDDLLRVGTEADFSDFDTASVSLPPGLPVD